MPCGLAVVVDRPGRPGRRGCRSRRRCRSHPARASGRAPRWPGWSTRTCRRRGASARAARSGRSGSVSLNQPDEELDPVVEQAVALEVVAHLVGADREAALAVEQCRRRRPGNWLRRACGRPSNESATQTLRVVSPQASRLAFMKMQAPPRQTPVSIRSPGTSSLMICSMQSLDVLHPAQPDHRLGAGRPVLADLPELRVVGLLDGDLEVDAPANRPTACAHPLLQRERPRRTPRGSVAVLGQGAGEAALQEVEVERAELVDAGFCAGHPTKLLAGGVAPASPPPVPSPDHNRTLATDIRCPQG